MRHLCHLVIGLEFVFGVFQPHLVIIQIDVMYVQVEIDDFTCKLENKWECYNLDERLT